MDLHIYETRQEMGADAAKDVAVCIRKLLSEKDEINCIFAAAPSQNEFLAALAANNSIEWERVNAYHMDDYVGFALGDPRSFNGFLANAIFSKVPFKSINLLNGENTPDAECKRYEALLQQNPTDIVLMGIGENGHIAFNDPAVADFEDEHLVKLVELDGTCRQQQVNDGCFPTLFDVPKNAFTVTIPGLMRAEHVFCIVPGAQKAAATAHALTGPINESCPASILRRHNNVQMYIDRACASQL
ncbi:MAG: glucosamine-6-phosphate deaminase [Ruthenibacterium sp.]